jgi:hypothetical protein
MKLITISCQAEDFIAEVEAFGQVRHKNLVKLLGYCIEGTYRYQVFFYSFYFFFFKKILIFFLKFFIE